MRRDTLFQTPRTGEDFIFNDQVAEVFDDMVGRSVPLYSTVIDAIVRLVDNLNRPRPKIYDLGCSTGTTLIELARRLQHLEPVLIGVDRAPAMLDKARRKAARYGSSTRIIFEEGDLETHSLTGADVILCAYTLQFIRPIRRARTVQRLYQALDTGGLFIACEKVLAEGPFHRRFIDIHHAFKRDQGYSDLEIAAKREALENVLVPFTVRENMELIRQAGFSHVETFCRWFNFAAFVALKS